MSKNVPLDLQPLVAPFSLLLSKLQLSTVIFKVYNGMLVTVVFARMGGGDEKG